MFATPYVKEVYNYQIIIMISPISGAPGQKAMTVPDFENVVYDENSDYKFDKLNETIFLNRFFVELQKAMAEDFVKYVFVIFSSHSITKIPSTAKKDLGRPKILIFISEEKGAYPQQLGEDFYAIFKSYLRGSQSAGQSVFPFPLGYAKAVKELAVIPIERRKYDVFFSGNLNDNRVPLFKQLSIFKTLLPERLLRWMIKISFIKKNITGRFFIKALKNSIIKFNTGFQKGLSPQEYAVAISESKIVFCPKGFDSAESFRHFEAMRAGCIIISEKLPDHKFYKNSPILQIKNWKEGVAMAEYFLANEEMLKDVHLQTVNWWREKCSEVAIANYVRQSIESVRH